MSIRVMNWVWTNSPEKGSALLLLLSIADHADDEGSAYPSVARLASKTRLSERNTQYQLKALCASGSLKILRGAGPKGCNLYRVQGLQGAIFGDEGVQPSVKRGATAIAPEPSRTIIKESSYTREFEMAFAALPKRAGSNSKKDAYKHWQARIKEGVPYATMIVGAERYATFIRATGKEGTEYVLTASTFFGRSKRYEEEFALPRKPTQQPAPPTDWWLSPAGVMDKAADVGIERGTEEDFLSFKCRLFAHMGDGPWINARNATEVRLVEQYQQQAAA